MNDYKIYVVKEKYPQRNFIVTSERIDDFLKEYDDTSKIEIKDITNELDNWFEI